MGLESLILDFLVFLLYIFWPLLRRKVIVCPNKSCPDVSTQKTILWLWVWPWTSYSSPLIMCPPQDNSSPTYLFIKVQERNMHPRGLKMGNHSMSVWNGLWQNKASLFHNAWRMWEKWFPQLTVKESLMCSSNCTLPGVGSRYSNALDQGWVLATCISSIQFSKRLLTCILCIYSTAQDAINVSMSKRRSSAP